MFSDLFSFFSSSPASGSHAHYLIVPDLHGTYSLYQKVEQYIKERVERERTIIFLGDYMDRGESGEYDGAFFKDLGSYQVIKALMAFQKWADSNNQEVVFLRGNHELFFEDYYLYDKPYAYKQYPFFRHSVKTLSYFFEKEKGFKEEFLTFLKKLRPYYLDKENHYLFIHAGIDPEQKDLEKQVEEGLVYWIRDKFLFTETNLPYTVVFGHTPFSKPFMRNDKIGLDSGVYKRGFINLLQIDKQDSKIIQLSNR